MKAKHFALAAAMGRHRSVTTETRLESNKRRKVGSFQKQNRLRLCRIAVRKGAAIARLEWVYFREEGLSIETGIRRSACFGLPDGDSARAASASFEERQVRGRGSKQRLGPEPTGGEFPEHACADAFPCERAEQSEPLSGRYELGSGDAFSRLRGFGAAP